MENYTTCLLCGLSTLILLLHSVEVSSVPLKTNSIVDVIRNDTNVCSLSRFLYESNIAKNCVDKIYPKDKMALTDDTNNIFLCLAVYDASFKICSYSNNKWDIPEETSAKFSTYIKQFYPDKNVDSRTKFCQSIRHYTPMYEKTKEFVSQLLKYMDDPFACHRICFDFEEEFNPLCAILAWIKQIEVDMKKQPVRIEDIVNTGEDNKKNSEQIQNNPLPNSRPNKSDKDEKLQANIVETIKQPDTTIKSDSKEQISTQTAKPAPKLLKPIEKTQEKLSDVTINKSKPVMVTQSQAVHLNDNSKSAVVLPDPPPKNPSKIKTDPAKKEDAKDASKTLDKSAIDSREEEAMQIMQSSVKTSTISENTQDREDLNGPMDYSRLDERPEEPDDVPEQPIDSGEQNPNMPEPSEQRDVLPHYHNVRSEEESDFFTYFTVISLVCIAAYIGYHNKQKILAIVLEGRRSRNNRGRRRPSTANYRKLDCTLEEAVTSQCNANVTHVIY